MKLTRKQKRYLVGALTTAAADMLGRRYDDTDDPEMVRDAYETVGRWLAALPGDEWDVRLPEPARRPVDLIDPNVGDVIRQNESRR